jgi:hypothetical protein
MDWLTAAQIIQKSHNKTLRWWEGDRSLNFSKELSPWLIKGEGNSAICSNMDEAVEHQHIMLSELIQAHKDNIT